MRLPTPAVNETGTLARGIPDMIPSVNPETASARAGCNLTLAIRIKRIRTAPAAQATRYQLEGGAPATGSTERLFHTPGEPENRSPVCLNAHFCTRRLCYH